MDTKTLVERLNHLFCEADRDRKRYSKVWLTDVDFGGLYENDMFVLHVKAEHEIDSCSNEIKDIIQLLQEKDKDASKKIWSVYVYNSDNEMHCWADDLIVLDDRHRCKV